MSQHPEHTDIILSVIVPAYNVAACIDACMYSLLNQGLSRGEYEIIAVDDGSDDETLQILEKYESSTPDFHVLHQNNRGSGNARNEGLRKARGRYVYFMDADDRLLPGALKEIFDNYVIPNDYPDVIAFWSKIVDRYYNPVENETIRPHSLIYKGPIYDFGDQRGVSFSIWNHIISRRILLDNGLLFNDFKIGEDMLFMLRLYNLKNVGIVATDADVYRYNTVEGSVYNLVENRHLESAIFDLIDLFNRIKKLREEYSLPDTYVKRQLEACQRWVFTRMLSGRFTKRKLMDFLSKCRENDIIKFKSSRKPIQRLINAVGYSPLAIYLMGIPYRRIFIPFVKPWIRRN